MNAQMRLVIMLTSVAVSGSLLFAAEPAPPAQKIPAPASTKQPAPPQKADDKASEEKKGAEPKSAEQSAQQKAETPPAEDQDPAKKRAASAADKAGSPQRFNPSEQVRADFDVSFPIDI
jgi:hypothetical protein